jgi:prepilin-type N-terminal cleavage/methylation domain-containing protein
VYKEYGKDMQRKYTSRVHGFTLIELVIVIGIIGVLAAVVLAAINIARAKAVDAATESNMDAARPQANIYFDDDGSYTGVCTTTPSVSGNPSINTNLVAAQTSSRTLTQPINTDVTVDGSYNTVTCHENGTAWAAEAPLTSSASGAPVMWCEDSMGTAKQETAILAANVAVCN